MFPLKAEKDDLRAVWYIRPKDPDTNGVKLYFEGISKLAEFLCSDELHKHINGFHLSLWLEFGIRFTFFTNVDLDSEDYLQEQFEKLSFERYLEKVEESPRTEQYEVYCNKGKSYLDFRRYLQLMTNIGLLLLEKDIADTRYMAARYRLEIGPTRVSAKPFFEEWFKDLDYFKIMDVTIKEELLDGFDFWFTDRMDWAHMFITMILPGDIVNEDSYEDLFVPRRPIPADHRKEIFKVITGDPTIVDNG
jgi:hypothetical protein